MPALSHNIDHDIPFNFYQPCPCGNISILNPLACFFTHAVVKSKPPKYLVGIIDHAFFCT